MQTHYGTSGEPYCKQQPTFLAKPVVSPDLKLTTCRRCQDLIERAIKHWHGAGFQTKGKR